MATANATKGLSGVFGTLLLISLLPFQSCTSTTVPNGEEKETIRISAILSLTGNAATLGEYAQKGLQLAVEELNAKGGVNGMMLDLDIHDSKSDPKEGVNIARKVLDDGQRPALVYCQLSSVSLAVQPITEKGNQLMFALSGADNLLTSSQYTFRNWLPPIEAGRALTHFMLDSLNIHEYGVLYANTEFARSMKDAANEEGSKIGMKTIFDEPFDESRLDYRTTILKCLAKKPENIYVVGIGKSLGTMVKQLREYGYSGRILGDATLNLPDVKAIAGAAMEGASFVDFGFDAASKVETSQAFSRSFESRFGAKPQTLSAISYDAIHILAGAIAEAKSLISANLATRLNSSGKHEGVFGDVLISHYNFIYPMSLKTVQQPAQ